jgi:hypothetical protein
VDGIGKSPTEEERVEGAVGMLVCRVWREVGRIKAPEAEGRALCLIPGFYAIVDVECCSSTRSAEVARESV